MQLTQRCLIVVCGLPTAYKTTVAKRLGQNLGIHRIDIDDLRVLHFGPPKAVPRTEAELGQDSREMAASYRTLLFGAEQMVGALGKPVIITATFSSNQWGQTPLAQLAVKLALPLKVVWLKPDIASLTDEELQRFLDRRREQGYVGALNDAARLRKLAEAYNCIAIPGALLVPTWPRYTSDEAVVVAERYCRDPESGYHPYSTAHWGAPRS